MEMAGTPSERQKFLVRCACCKEQFLGSSPRELCSNECRAKRRSITTGKRTSTDPARGAHVDWLPTPREILERRLDLHENIGTEAGPELDKILAAKIRERLESREWCVDADGEDDPRFYPLHFLGVPEDILRALEKANLKLIGEVALCSDEYLLSLPRMGIMKVERLRRALRSIIGD